MNQVHADSFALDAVSLSKDWRNRDLRCLTSAVLSSQCLGGRVYQLLSKQTQNKSAPLDRNTNPPIDDESIFEDRGRTSRRSKDKCSRPMIYFRNMSIFYRFFSVGDLSQWDQLLVCVLSRYS